MCSDDPVVSLGELVELRTEKTVSHKDASRPYLGLEHISSGSPDILGYASAETSVSTNGVFEANDILFGKLRPNLHKCVLAPFAGYCSTDILVLRTLPGVVPVFAAKQLQSEPVFEHAVKTAVGTKMPRTSWSELRGLQVFCPPLPEQVRIAEILDTLDEAIRKTEQVIAKLQRMKQGLLHDLLTRGVDENGDLRPPPDQAPHLYKDSVLGLVPKEWEVERLANRISMPTGQLDPRIDPYRSWVLVAPDHIEPSTGRLLQRVSAKDQGAISGKYGFEPGDVVYSKIRPYLRKAVLVDFSGLCSADMYPFRPGQTLNGRFLLALLLGEHFSHFAEAVSMRSGFPKLNRDEFAEYHCALPIRQEQDRIAVILSAKDRQLSDQESSLSKLRSLKQGLLHDLLTGRVRVPIENVAEEGV